MKTFIGNNCYVEILEYQKLHQNLVEEKISLYEKECKDDHFIIGDLGDVYNKYTNWKNTLPRVEPFYAVKCNDDYAVLKVMADLGMSFDCASKGEIQKVLDLGVAPKRIIYANPCKQASYVKYAAKHNISLMTFDNEDELYKIKRLYPSARLVIRMLPPANFKVQCELGMKFGCHPSKAEHLLSVARELQLNVMGVSFHVGSGCEEASAFAVAIEQARTVFDKALEMGFNMKLLDIGGGFPGQESASITFEEIADVVSNALDQHFPESEDVKIIAEPGRYFVATAFTLSVNIIAKRIVARDQKGENGEPLDHPSASDEPCIMYYVNDGVYGSFNCLLFDHASVSPCILKDQAEEFRFMSSIWGPTCDGLDCIEESIELPMLDVGQWMYFKDMGAYTISSASTFNGMPGPARFYVCNKEIWQEMHSNMEGKGLKGQSSFCGIPRMVSGHSFQELETIPGTPPAEHFLIADGGFDSAEH